MVLNDPLANALSAMLNNEKIGRTECSIKPISMIIKEVLRIMKENEYISDFKEIADGRGNMIKAALSGMINKCGAIKPRYPVSLASFEKFEKRYLPAKDVGILIVSTPLGIITHIEAKAKKTGGRLIAYCY